MYKLIESLEFDIDPILGEPDSVKIQTLEDIKISNNVSLDNNYNDPATFNPVQQLKVDPMHLPIAQYNDKFYIDYKDFTNFMNASKLYNYEDAVDKIIDTYYNKDGISLSKDNIIIMMHDNDLQNIDYYTKSLIEKSSIKFGVYK